MVMRYRFECESIQEMLELLLAKIVFEGAIFVWFIQRDCVSPYASSTVFETASRGLALTLSQLCRSCDMHGMVIEP